MRDRHVPRAPMEWRFWTKVVPNDETGCWEWTGARAGNGYGTIITGSIGRDRRHKLVHRVSYELCIGPIPPGLLVCHTCDNRRCVNPGHFFLGDHRANARDMVEKGRGPQRDMTSTHCVKGHAYTPSNTLYRNNGSRRCRECSRLDCLTRSRRIRAQLRTRQP